MYNGIGFVISCWQELHKSVKLILEPLLDSGIKANT